MIKEMKIDKILFFLFSFLFVAGGLVRRNKNDFYKLSRGNRFKEKRKRHPNKGISIDPIVILPIAEKQSNRLSLVINRRK